MEQNNIKMILDRQHVRSWDKCN